MRTQALRKVAIELDHHQPTQTLDQGLSQRSQTRADLDHRLTRTGVDGTHDLMNDRVIDQEMLAEALARNVLHLRRLLTTP